jgi:hypothetical protein
MKITNVALFLCVCVAAVAGSPASYDVTLYQPSVVAGKQLPKGEYHILVRGDKAVMGKGKLRVEAPVRVQTGGEKFTATSVRYIRVDGKLMLQEIQVRGTKTTLFFAEPEATAAGVN